VVEIVVVVDVAAVVVTVGNTREQVNVITPYMYIGRREFSQSFRFLGFVSRIQKGDGGKNR